MPRAWYREHFTDHPAYTDGNSASDAFTGSGRTRDKVKVWCTECYSAHLAQVMPPALLHADRSDPTRFEFECRLWNESNAAWIPSRRNACLLHLRDCLRQPYELRDRAASQHQSYLERRRGRDRSLRESRRSSTQSEPVCILSSGEIHAGGSSAADYADATGAGLHAASNDHNNATSGHYTHLVQPDEPATSGSYDTTSHTYVQDAALMYPLSTLLPHNYNLIPYPSANALAAGVHYYQGTQLFAEVPYYPDGFDHPHNSHIERCAPGYFPPAS